MIKVKILDWFVARRFSVKILSKQLASVIKVNESNSGGKI